MASVASGILLIFAVTDISPTVAYDVREMQINGEPRKWFSWANCAKNAPFDVTALSISPDPVHESSKMYLSFVVDAKQDIPTAGDVLQAHIEARLTTETGTVVNLCDFVPESICDPPDVCSLFKQMKTCPEAIDKLVPHCQCPLKKNHYQIENASFPLPSIPLEGLLTVNLTVTQKDQPIACLDLQICVGKCAPKYKKKADVEMLLEEGGGM